MPAPRSKRETLQNPRAKGGKDKYMRENVAEGFDATTKPGNYPGNARATTSDAMEPAHMEHGDGKPSGVVGDKMKPARMGSGDGQSSGVSFKAEDEEEEEDYDPRDHEDDEDDSDDEGKKSMAYDSNDLIKALDDFELVEETLSESAAEYDREGFLLAKLNDGTLTKAERAELGEIMMKSGGDDEDEDEPVEDWEADEIFKSMSEHIAEVDQEHADLLDASPFLGSLAKALDASLDTLRKAVSDDGRTTRAALQATGTLLKATAQHQIQLVDMIKSLQDQLDAANERLETVEDTPVQPRSVVSDRGQSRNIAKSALGGQPGQIRRDDLYKALNAMTVEAAERGDNQALDQLTTAVAKLEAGGPLDPNLQGAVVQRFNQGV